MRRQPRKSISEQFPELVISSPGSAIMPAGIHQRSVFRSTSSEWPAYGSDMEEGTGRFTIRLSEFLQKEAKKQQIKDPAAVITTLREASLQGGTPAKVELWNDLTEALIDLVYGSNRIEDAGNNFQITVQLCRKVFNGDKVDAAAIEPRTPEYEAHLSELVRAKRQVNQTEVIRSRHEIIQHAQALDYIIDKIITQDEDWTEILILETHRILYNGLGDNEWVKPGQYRDGAVAASYVDPKDPKQKVKTHQFIRHQMIKPYMQSFVSELNADIQSALAEGTLDPYNLAAHYTHRFANIHPFADGNGRISRIILNVLLLKYAGHITTFGGDDEEKDMYIGIAHRASKTFHQEDGEVPKEEQVGHHELARYVLAKSKSRLERLWRWANHGRKGQEGTEEK